MKKMYLFLATALLTLLPLAVSAAELPFEDVSDTEWYYNDVASAYDSGLINGTGTTKFAPKENLTHGAAVKLAACIYQLYTEGEITLTAGNPWYQPYVDYAIDHKILDGVSAFDPNGVINRSRFIELFSKALPKEALAPINLIQDGAIRDVPMSSPRSAAVYTMYRAGIVQGSGDNHSFYPNQYITRAEVAAVITRMMNPDRRLSFSMKRSMTTACRAAYEKFLKNYKSKVNPVFDLVYIDSTDENPALVITENNSALRNNEVSVYRYTPSGVEYVTVAGGYGGLTFFPHHSYIHYSMTGGDAGLWAANDILYGYGNSYPKEGDKLTEVWALKQVVFQETGLIMYGSSRINQADDALTKEEYDGQLTEFNKFVETESVGVFSQWMYAMDDAGIKAGLK